MINVVFFFSFLILLYAVSAQFYSISYLQLKSPKEDKMAVSQCCLCCPLVFLCHICIVAFFFYFCAVSGPVLHPCQLSTRFWIFLKPPFLLHHRFSVYTKPVNPLTETTLETAFQTRGEGGAPYDGLCEEAPPERGLFFRFQV